MFHDALIAEDDPALAELFSKAFLYAGFRVKVVHNGEEVIQRVREIAPEVLILDLGLPGLSGLDILRDIRQHDPDSRLQIIVVTGNHLAESRPEIEAADLFLLKPVDILELVTLAQRLRTRKIAS